MREFQPYCQGRYVDLKCNCGNNFKPQKPCCDNNNVFPINNCPPDFNYNFQPFPPICFPEQNNCCCDNFLTYLLLIGFITRRK